MNYGDIVSGCYIFIPGTSYPGKSFEFVLSENGQHSGRGMVKDYHGLKNKTT